jgi:pilus assembly protein FimV
LGRLTVLSGLGQPLRAEIEIVSLQRGEAETLAAQLATQEAFRQANIEFSPTLQNLRFAVERRPNNRYVINMTSTTPVNDPFLDVLVELSWAAGRLVREYTFLLDPQEFKPQAQAQVTPPAAAPRPVEPPRAAAPAQAAPTEEPKPEAPKAEAPAPAPAPAQAPIAAAKPAADGATYTVARGDTLGRIAQQYRPEGVTLQQMLTALYRANQDAFVGRNMNRLRSGRILSIPDAATVQGIPAQEANAVVVAQWQEWNAYRAQLAAAVAAGPARQDGPAQGAGGRITARVTEKPPAGGPQDRLQIAQADPANAANAAGRAAAKADDSAARERALKEAQGRVVALEKNVKDLERLLDLKNQELARLQEQAKASKAAPAPKPAAKAPEVAKPEPVKPEPAPVIAKADPAPKVEAPAPKPEPARVEVPKPEAPKAEAPKVEAPKPEPVTPPVVAAEPPKPAPAPAPAPVAETGILDDLTSFLGDNLLYVGGGAAGILALVGGLVAMRRRKAAQLEDSLIGATQADASSVFGSTGGRSVDTGNSVQTDFSQGGIGAIDTDEVDPVAEADVYMAYGRDAQAEEILKEALQKDPNRHAVRVKLLEIYAARKDQKAFETTAGELYAATNGEGPEWEKAAALGAQIDPANTLYALKQVPGAASTIGAAAVGAGVAAAASAMPDFGLGDTTAKAFTPPPLDISLETTGRFQPAPDLSLDVTAEPKTAAPVTDLGFDLNLSEPTEPALSEKAPVVAAAAPDLAIDLELSQPLKAAQAAAPAVASSNVIEFDLGSPTTTKPAVDLGGINLDLGSPPADSAASLDAHWQEVATKLDLAKAYHEMGDREGAKELLGEVLKEGDGAQQQQARKMLETIG